MFKARWKLACLTVIVLAGLITIAPPRCWANNYTYELYWVHINGQQVHPAESPVVSARLGSTLIVNACWFLLYDPYNENCCVQFELYNNVSLIEKSPRYFDNNKTSTIAWSVPLLPSDWSLNGRQEYGRVSVIMQSFSSGITDSKKFTIIVLPEQLECAYSSRVLKNDSDGRMYFMNVSFHVGSLQDPSRAVNDVAFTFELCDLSGLVFHSWIMSTDAYGNLHLVLTRDVLFELERYKIRGVHAQTNKDEYTSIELRLDELLQRECMTCTPAGVTRIDGDPLFAATVSFSLDTDAVIFDEAYRDVYYRWNVSDGLSQLLDQGYGFATVDTVFSFKIKNDVLPTLEALSLNIMIEGNFLLQGIYFRAFLGNLFCRDIISLEITNIEKIQNGNANSIQLRVLNASSAGVVAFKPFTVTWIKTTNTSCFSNAVCSSNNDGFVCLVPEQHVLDEIEIYSISVDAESTVDFLSVHEVFMLDSLFSRNTLDLECYTARKNVSLSIENDYTFQCNFIPDVYSFVNFSGALVNIDFLDLHNHSLFSRVVPLCENGSLLVNIPAKTFEPFTNYSILLSVNSTFKYKPFFICLSIEVGKIDGYDWYVHATMILYIVLGSSSAGLVILAPFCYKKIKYKVLTKKDFTIDID